MAPRSMSATRSSITAMWWTACETKGAIFVEELAEIPDNTNAPVVFSAHGVPKSVPADAQAAQFLLARRHLSAGHQGAPRGGDPFQARPRNPADRAFPSSGSGRHARPVAAGRGDADRDRAGRRDLHAEGSQQPRLRDPDHAVDRRHRRNRRDAEGSASRTSRGRTRKTSATPPPTASSRSRRWRRWSMR